ncbi:MAG TPA: SUMF1/EgtB/PvdO family nonheme iron enzyme [Candidatus Cloacimonadota bacterium]|nr:SUMF1/EgtB/PvdO family nonheme iron enzyme [Candidatus Cloacimonadota bacterium]HPK40914.1 SUMF1/EgtB/PvdO family nonheme iron enzyme [Candidatus Cloacimonadota bacterium]HPY96175.1 SUMF1/EgtB/PvdO family nonheme iron enzyme [Candidatus Cloacimonadota bacterium]HQB41391.1 SUMF1/EgtB/PvdO family nonheme iron enzyme [Candidatus Cloacimonadota bacterium]
MLLNSGNEFGGKNHNSGSNRVNRGGSWNNNDNNCRVANRNNNSPGNSNNNLGLRVLAHLQNQI